MRDGLESANNDADDLVAVCEEEIFGWISTVEMIYELDSGTVLPHGGVIKNQLFNSLNAKAHTYRFLEW